MDILSDIAFIALACITWSFAWMLDRVSKFPEALRPIVPAMIAFMGAYIFSGTQIAGMLEGILGWLVNFFPGGGLVLGAATILLLAGIVRGLLDKSLDKRDIGAIIALPLLTLPMGGPIGNTSATLRDVSRDAVINVIGALTGMA